MEERGRVTGCGGCGVAGGVGAAGVWGGVWAAPLLASATALRNPRRPVGLVGICCDCSMFRGVEVADFGGFAFLYEQSQKGRGGERGGLGRWRWGGSLVRFAAAATPIFETGDRLVNANWTNEANRSEEHTSELQSLRHL